MVDPQRKSVRDVLRNPADDHKVKVFDKSIRGHTDQFVFKFRKPKTTPAH